MTWNDDLWVEPVLPDANGNVQPPERPGHGLACRPEILRDCRVGGSRMTADGKSSMAVKGPASSATMPASTEGATVASGGAVVG